MPVERLLRIAAIYHAVLGAVALLLPGDLLRSLGIDPPTTWLFYALAAAAPAVAAGLLETARRRPELRAGLALAVQMGNLAAMGVLCFFTVTTDLPSALLGPGAAAGLWAWLLWSVYSPEPRDHREEGT